MNRSNFSSEIGDETRTENLPLGAEPAHDAPSTNGTPSEPKLEPSPSAAEDQSRAQLEERLCRLEDSLAQLHARQEPPPTALAAPVATIVPPSPAPITTTPTEAASSFLFHVGKQMLAAPLATVTQPPHPVQESTFAAGLRWTWFFFDAYAELRVILRMFVDPRYQMSWTSRLVPFVLAVLLFTSSWWMPGSSIPWIGTLIDKLIDLPLAFLLFKVLSHEARRYRQLSPDLPTAWRLPPDR